MEFAIILNQYNLSQCTATTMDGYASTNFKIATEKKNYVLKLYNDAWATLHQIKAENEILLQLNKSCYPFPYKNNEGNYVTKVSINGKPKLARLLSYLEGRLLAESVLAEPATIFGLLKNTRLCLI